MAKKSTSSVLAAGTRIRVKPGVSVPEFSEVSCEGWTGTIAELTGKKTDPKYVIEWDEETVGKMPPSYVQACESQNLYYRMAYFGGDEIELATA